MQDFVQERKKQKPDYSLLSSTEHAGEQKAAKPAVLTSKMPNFSESNEALLSGIGCFLTPLERGVKAGQIKDLGYKGKRWAYILSSIVESGGSDHLYVTSDHRFYSMASRVQDEKVIISLGTTPEAAQPLTTLTISDMKGNVVAHFVEKGGELSIFAPKPGSLSVA